MSDPTDWISAIGNTSAALINAGSTIYNSKEQRELQENLLKFNKDLVRQQMEREDNYMQRRFADFTAAGYSPIAALENAAGNYSSTVTPLSDDYSSFANLQSGMNQAMAQLGQGFQQIGELGVQRAKIDEQKRTNMVLEAIEYDKLDEQKKEFVDTLKQQESLAEKALKNQKDIANISAEAQKEIARKTRAMTESLTTESEKNKMKMFEAQLNQAWDNAKKARSQNERKIWIDAVSKILATAGAAAISGVMHNPNFMNFESAPAYQMGFHE